MTHDRFMRAYRWVAIAFTVMLAMAVGWQAYRVATGRCEHPRYGITVHGALLLCEE
jgi:hypothetical protein